MIKDARHIKEHIDYELLADYVDGIIGSKARTRISEHVNGCERCQKIVEGIEFYYQQHGDDRDGLEAYLDDLAVRLSKKKISKPKADSQGSIRFLWKTIVAVAAIALLFLLPMYFTNSSNSVLPNSGKDWLAMELTTPYAAPADIQRGDTNVDTWRMDFQKAYKSKDYAKGEELMKKIIPTPSIQNSDYFYLGLCQLYQSDAKAVEAIGNFQEVLMTDSRYKEQARWYMALAHFKAGNKSDAEGILQSIVNDSDSTYKHREAKLFLESDWE